MAEMVDVKYTGTSSWARVIVDDDGKFVKQESVLPGQVVSLPEDAAKHLCEAGNGDPNSPQTNFVAMPKKEAAPAKQEERKQVPAQQAK